MTKTTKFIRLGILLLAALIPLALPATLQAQFTFTTNNGAITITGYTGTGGTVVIPSTTNGYPVTSIGTNAFFYSGLRSVTIPIGVTNIGSFAFGNCSSLTNVTIGNGVRSIGDFAFSSCTKLASITIPDSITCVGNHAFSSCTTLTNAAIGNGVTNIGDWAFSFTSLANVTIGTNVASIGEEAFAYCDSLTAITLDTNNPAYSSLDGVLFNKRQTTLIQYPGGKTGSYTVLSSVTSIGGGAFYHCINLTNVTIPNSVTSIGFGAFHSCTSLTSVTIPNCVITIGDGAFVNCTTLASVTIPSSVTNIGYAPFAGCTSLGSITVDTNCPAYCSVAGVLFNKNQTILIQYPGAKAGGYTVPNSVTNMADGVFYGCINLIDVELSTNTTSIGTNAFSYCSSLTNVTVPNSVTSIGDEAFVSCTSLTSVTIPNSVTSIGDFAFESCTKLARITVGNSVTNIGNYAFAWCSDLTSVLFEGNAPNLDSDYTVLTGDNKTTVYYLSGTTKWGATFAYMPAFLWNPQAQTGDANFGVRTNWFGFTITGSSNLVIVVEASTNLTDWLPVSTNTLNTFIGTNGTSYFSDSQRTNSPGRFYRLRSP